jgi:AcrR family transcriptional regulator
MRKAGKTARPDVVTGRGDKTGHGRTIWLQPTRTQRTRPPPITRARIVSEAIALLDGYGVKGLTMRRLAERLGTGSATLYWHMRTKDEVLELALDAIFGEIPVPSQAHRDWKNDLRSMMLGWRAAMLRHPWTTALPGRPLLGPNILLRMEFLQATLVRAGFGKEHLGPVTWALANYVMGVATAQVNWHMRSEERPVAQNFLNAHREQYPTLASQGYMLYDDRDAAFKWGLTYLFDGIDARRSRRHRSP